MEELNPTRLVFTSAGDRSNLDLWLPDKRFDLWVSYYGDEPDRYSDRADFYEMKKGAKFPKLYELAMADPERLSAYEHVWVADDDLRISGRRINRLFEIARELDLWVAQPGFLDAGKISNKVTRKRQFAYLRYTNFVEVTCPLFRTDKLLEFFEVYDPKLVGFGVDWWFMEALAPPVGKAAVIDGVPCVNPNDREKGGVREIDAYQGYDERRRVWEEVKQERGLTLDQTKRMSYRVVYTWRSVLTGLARPDWFLRKAWVKARKWVRKRVRSRL
ncbi:MAG: hypothetical protein ACYTGQ_00290 [Planctomycetota bacterium]|jgi:hypothetical protein